MHGGSPQGELNFSFVVRDEDELSIAALEGGLAPGLEIKTFNW